MMNKTILVLAVILGLMSCKSDKSQKKSEPTKTPEEKVDAYLPEWAKSSNIYEVNLRQYTKSGTINSFSDHIPRLKDMGVDILWLMPVFPISESRKKGTLGSYYAVSDFREVNPEFGMRVDLENLITKIHAYKMHVILDWVPNHTGWDHKWIKEHPEWYTKGPDGKITDPLNDEGESHGWTDVADLNYDNAEMRAQMLDDLKFWVEKGVDGFRMDIAFGVPLDFWQTAIPELRKINPDLFFLAESEEPDHVNQELFHANYGWSMHHLLNAIAKGEKNVKDLEEWVKTDKRKIEKGSMMHFTSNHDENSWNGSEQERMGKAHQIMAVFTMLYDGIPLVYSGQEEPLTRRLEFFEKDDIGFKELRYHGFYKQMLKLKKQHPALWNLPYGAEAEQITQSEHIFGFKREKSDDKVVFIGNFTNQPRNAVLLEDLQDMTNIIKNTPVSYKKGEKLTLEPYKYIVAVPK